MIDITLAKAKYRPTNHRVLHRQQLDPPEGTRVVVTGFASKTANAGKANKARTLAPKQRAYGPWWWELGHERPVRN